jgi:hypothetical protein
VFFVIVLGKRLFWIIHTMRVLLSLNMSKNQLTFLLSKSKIKRASFIRF